MVSKRANSAPAVNFQKLLFELAWSKSCKKHHAFNWYTCNYVSMSCRITFYTECYMYSTRDCLAKHRDDEDELMSATDYHLPDSQDKNHVIATRDIEWGCTGYTYSTIDKTHGVIHLTCLQMLCNCDLLDCILVLLKHNPYLDQVYVSTILICLQHVIVDYSMCLVYCRIKYSHDAVLNL